jgi:hypothetical protein
MFTKNTARTAAAIAHIVFLGMLPSFPVRAAPAPLVEYAYVEDLTRWVEIKRGSSRLFGHLDADGNFVQEFKIAQGAPTSVMPRFESITPDRLFLTPVYEFRAGRLVKGVLRQDGHFVPDVGSKVIRFDDYKYDPGAVPIWNLPGRFQPKVPAKTSKDGK